MRAKGRHQHKAGAGKSQADGKVRIIAGCWRGSRLDVPKLPGLRPSGERVRETLFNWLQGYLPGARCLDLFAGSGVLGLEAASRGAAEVVLVEHDAHAVQGLNQSCQRLKANQVEVVQVDALVYLAQQPKPFDLVFVDPPFAANLWDDVLQRLDDLVKPGGCLYVEMPLQHALQYMGPGWMPMHEQQIGQVRLYLLRKGALQSVGSMAEKL